MENSYNNQSAVYFPGDPLDSPLGHIPHRYLPIGIRLSGSMLILTMPQRRNQRDTGTLTEISGLEYYEEQTKSVQIDFAGPALFVSQEDFYATVRSMKNLIRGLNSRLPNLQKVAVTVHMKGSDCNPLTTRRVALLGALHGLKLPWSINYLIDARLPSKEEKVSEELIKEKLEKSWKLTFMSSLRGNEFPAFFDPFPTEAVDPSPTKTATKANRRTLSGPSTKRFAKRSAGGLNRMPTITEDFYSSTDSSPEFGYAQLYPYPTEAAVDFHSSTGNLPQFGDAQPWLYSTKAAIDFRLSTGNSSEFSDDPASFGPFPAMGMVTIGSGSRSSTGGWPKFGDADVCQW
jgi:hypothetical protein